MTKIELQQSFFALYLIILVVWSILWTILVSESKRRLISELKSYEWISRFRDRLVTITNKVDIEKTQIENHNFGYAVLLSFLLIIYLSFGCHSLGSQLNDFVPYNDNCQSITLDGEIYRGYVIAVDRGTYYMSIEKSLVIYTGSKVIVENNVSE